MTTTNPTPNAIRVTCDSVLRRQPDPRGQRAPIARFPSGRTTPLRAGLSRASPLQVRVDSAPLGARRYAQLSACTNTIVTHIKVDSLIPAAPAGAVFEILMPNAGAKDFLEVQECFLTDSTMAKKGVATVNRIVKC